jgi:hypothetical protein
LHNVANWLREKSIDVLEKELLQYHITDFDQEILKSERMDIKPRTKLED